MTDSEDINVRSPPDWWEQAAPWQEDSSATAEDQQFKRLDDIEDQKKENRKKVHAVLGRCIPLTVGLAFALFWLRILIYCWHLATPWGWMTAEQQKELHTLLFSSALGAVVIQGARRYLD